MAKISYTGTFHKTAAGYHQFKLGGRTWYAPINAFEGQPGDIEITVSKKLLDKPVGKPVDPAKLEETARKAQASLERQTARTADLQRQLAELKKSSKPARKAAKKTAPVETPAEQPAQAEETAQA